MKKSSVFKGIIAVTVCAALGVGAAYAVNAANLKKMTSAVDIDTFYNGISVNGISLGGLNMEEAEQKLYSDINDTLKEKTIHLIGENKSFDIKYGDIDAKYNIDDTLLAAYNYGRNGDVKERYKIVSALEENPKDFEAQFTYNKELLKNKIDDIAVEIKVEPENSTMSRKDGKFIITDEKVGYSMDTDLVYKDVLKMVENIQEGDTELKVDVIQPKITKEDNEKATSLIGTYYTTFSGGNSGRNENLRVGCENINGTELAPGEIFSMNEELGPQTYENGYRDAAVIVNGKIEDGLAGGGCQITTTLYNAVILAELDIVERANHSLAVAYVPLGRDAAIAGDYKDLKFKNSTEYPVYIEAYLSGNKLIANVYGHEIHSPSREVRFDSVVNSVIPKPAEKVTTDPEKPTSYREVTYYGKEGRKVSTYKTVYENGKEISRELFNTSTYRATPDEVTVGSNEEAVQTLQQEQTEQDINNEEITNENSIFGN